ncbi:apolipoprotein N-acyltransferase [Govanella unica]|uniref:Apolipoprotein N-acyltransferase n=1 Tax=Govanella unica TaxID=2975056 RepID=A0A9X3TZ99_9PROT|nr:apolipoprotein N-acyltransferase [Govania unica]MDA5194690.1 apolipoprotein N-acyltransferase [Govania unica]
MIAWAERIAGMSNLGRCGLAICFGALATLALPPLYIIPAFFIAFPAIFLLLRQAGTSRAALLLGWGFGFGHYVTGFYWIAIAFFVNESVSDAAGPVAVVALAAVMALYPVLAFWVFHRLQSFMRGALVAEIILFALCWSATEWLRGHLFTGFPWNLAGSIWAFSPAMLQSLTLWGAYGLGLLTVLAACLLAAGALGRFRPVLAAVLMLGLCYGGGVWRLAGDHGAVEPGVRLRLVQANVKQGEKWREDRMADNFMSYVRLSATPSDKPVTHILWPETASPFFLNAEPAARAAIARITPPGGYVIAGAPGYYADPAGGEARVGNSLFVIDDQGKVRAGYDKAHLVPFGEYLPMRGFMTLLGFERFVPGLLGSDFTAGPGPQSLHVPGLPAFSPLICYEVIFPGAVVKMGDRPGWILNVTNDGWYGQSAGPYQHLATAQMRAVEEGLPVVRVAGTGISAVISPYGAILARLPLGTRGILDSDLPRKVESQTLFSRAGDWSYLGLFVILAALATGARGVANGARLKI